MLALAAHRVAGRLPLLAPAHRRRRAAAFREDLLLLNDVLAGTRFGAHYWVWGGMLLGWAREGGLLAHDVGDADFCYDASADAEFAAAVPALRAAGFRPWFSYRDSDGELRERVFVRRGSKFEFFRLTTTGEEQEYRMFGSDGLEPVEVLGRIPAQRPETFSFLGRRWNKPVDHEGLLRRHYGDWRIPVTDWHYLTDDGTVVETRPWVVGPAQDTGR
ncbi:hypothetical protein [Pseudonocardia sp. ICBG162]|uniref:hypothetical protein n=1 Tax=Pseudonocardia sp. ICBG162 TaxID=2846761 RepID=UPI001CF63165|nr:hypothetical protein [Pseudonocardia sp. ICBG162]